MRQSQPDTLITELRAAVGRDRVLAEPDELLVYECDGLTHYKVRPRAVVFPRSTEEVAAAIIVLARAGVSFAPRGAGTGLSGGALAVNRGVVIELAGMRRLLNIDVENRLAVAETGMINAQLSRVAAPFGLHYAPDPSSQATCTIGGNIAENAGGIHCLKYGTTVDHVLSARVVLSDGEVVQLGGAGAEAIGYDLLGVFVGSEGTFGIATEATVRLTPLPVAVRTLLADFADVDDASRAVSAIIAEGIIPAALEMVDGATIRAVEASVFAAGLPIDAEAALLVELDGLEAGLDEEAARVESICRTNGARYVRRAADEYERKKLWAARKGAFGAMGRISPDLMLQDAVVPRSRLPEVLAAIYRIGAKYRLRVANVFHAGDGNLHPFICFDSRIPDEIVRVKEAGREMMETCVRAGGTITGEHGVGLDKSDYLPLIFSDFDLETMLRVRAAFDPLGICNPGKIIPTLRGCGEARAVAAAKTERRELKEGEALIEASIKSSVSEAAARTSSRVSLSIAAATPAPVFTPSSPLTHLSAGESLADPSRVPLSASTSQHRDSVRTQSFDADHAFSCLTRIVGEEFIRASSHDAGTLTVVPASTDEACEVLRLAAAENWKIVPAGAGMWLDAVDSMRRADVVIKTDRMAKIIEHEPADLVATAQAGVRLASLNEELSRAGQWLPLDPPGCERATLGGIAATALGGAQAFGYGLPRGYVLGMRVALADGRVARAGGRVVKNVAGYDLCKLFVGSFGTLGLILELTFKLRPRPAREVTVVARAADYHSLLNAGRALISAQLLPIAVELFSPAMARTVGLDVGATDGENNFALMIRFAGSVGTVAFQVDQTCALLHGNSSIHAIHAIDTDAQLWADLAVAPLKTDNHLIWRAGVRPAGLGLLLDEFHHVRNNSRSENLSWHAGLGDGRLRVIEAAAGESRAIVASLEKMRGVASAAGGSLVLERAAPAITAAFDLWGLTDSTKMLMRRVKNQLDPQDLFSPGRFGGE